MERHSKLLLNQQAVPPVPSSFRSFAAPTKSLSSSSPQQEASHAIEQIASKKKSLAPLHTGPNLSLSLSRSESKPRMSRKSERHCFLRYFYE